MTSFEINRKGFADQTDFIKRGFRCASHVPNDLEIERTGSEIRKMRTARATRMKGVEINVQYIHITNGNEGHITEEQRINQINVMNDAFSSTGIKFKYDPEKFPAKIRDNGSWFLMGLDSAAERAAKTELHVDPKFSLNFYTAGLQDGLLGWARFPWMFAGDEVMDGVVILSSSLPGGTAVPYNLGQTATHEVGHWLGLWHTFQGGCNGSGDQVDDTEAHSGPNYGCGNTIIDPNNFCQGESQSPLKNYMNYVDDACMTEYTPGQANRIKDMIETYRNDLIIGPL